MCYVCSQFGASKIRGTDFLVVVLDLVVKMKNRSIDMAATAR